MARGIVFLIRSLNVGGSERQLITLALGLHRRGHRVVVATFYPGGVLEWELVDSGVPLFSLEKSGRWDLIGGARRLVQLVRREQPAVLHSYLPDSNILAALAKPFFPGVRLVWGVRAAFLDLTKYDRVSRLSYSTAALLSRRADLVIANSHAAAAYLRTCRYPEERLRVIHNGVDVARFRYDVAGRARLRQEWKVSETSLLIGLVGRLDPMKDHHTFLRAAALLAARAPDVRFVCVGEGPADYARSLRNEAAALGLDERLVWAGVRTDLPAVYSALDVATCTSVGESFPNVVAEAMACGTACVVTDVGDAALLVAHHGTVVLPDDPAAIAAGWERALHDRNPDRAADRRNHIVEHFNQDRLIAESERLLLGAGAGPR